MDLTDVDLELTYDKTTQVVGLRWTGLEIPKGATITAAYIQFAAKESHFEATQLSIRAQAADNAGAFTTSNGNISTRPRTTATVAWNPFPWTSGTVGEDQKTPDLASVIQEVVNRDGWASGNALAMVITGTGHRTAWSYEGNASAAALLHVEYTVIIEPPPTPPDEIHWTLMGQTAVTFDWRGGTDTLRYGLTPAYGQIALAAAPNPMPFSSTDPFREAKLTGLAENTTYHYSISGGPDHTFRTPPPRGGSGFTIVAQGDIGANKDWPRVAPIQSRIASMSPAFVLMLGDLTYGDDYGQPSVDAHFNDMMVWSQDAAYMPVWGNHEWGVGSDDLRNYKGRFDLPNPQGAAGSPAPGCCNEDWSWFDYGNVRFISYPEPYSGAWADWATRAAPIMDAAQADTAIDFIVTFGHQPALSSGWHDGHASLENLIAGLAANHSKYVLNLNGHSHNYERSHPQAGVVHITAGTGGSSLEAESSPHCMWTGGCPAPAWSAFRAMRHVVLQLRFVDGAIEGTAFCGPAQAGKNDILCTEGTVVDTFRIGGQAPPPPLDPIASLVLTPSSGTSPLTVTTNAAGSSDPDGSIVSYRFDFGDGTVVGPQAEATSTHTYGPGTWTASVTVTDDSGATATDSVQVSVNLPGGSNLVANPSFESATTGWIGYNSATVARVPDGHEGAFACQLTSTVSGSFGINDSPSCIGSTPAAGTQYRFGAWVRSPANGGQARLRVTEYLGTTRIGSTLMSSPVDLTPAWQELTMDFVSGAAGSWLDFQVVDFPLAIGEVFLVDEISISLPGSAVGVGDQDLSKPRALVFPSPMEGTGAGTIAFTTTREGGAKIELFDLSGRRVARLLEEARLQPGRHSVSVRLGRDPGGLAAGMYLYRVSLDEAVLSGRFVVLP